MSLTTSINPSPWGEGGGEGLYKESLFNPSSGSATFSRPPLSLRRASAGDVVADGRRDLFKSPIDGRNEYRVRDLAGCEVVTAEGERLGLLVDVLPSGGNDIFVVQRPGREILIPALKQVVRSIDLLQKQMEVVLPAGLREIYDPPQG